MYPALSAAMDFGFIGDFGMKGKMKIFFESSLWFIFLAIGRSCRYFCREVTENRLPSHF
jgi:hypothetical protein